MSIEVLHSHFMTDALSSALVFVPSSAPYFWLSLINDPGNTLTRESTVLEVLHKISPYNVSNGLVYPDPYSASFNNPTFQPNLSNNILEMSPVSSSRFFTFLPTTANYSFTHVCWSYSLSNVLINLTTAHPLHTNRLVNSFNVGSNQIDISIPNGQITSGTSGADIAVYGLHAPAGATLPTAYSPTNYYSLSAVTNNATTQIYQLRNTITNQILDLTGMTGTGHSLLSVGTRIRSITPMPFTFTPGTPFTVRLFPAIGHRDSVFP